MSTYNRAALLPRALSSLMDQETPGFEIEIVVVDNNSSDNTRQVIEEFVSQSSGRMRYVFEGKQGVSNGWNTGISIALGAIVAITDDDLAMPRDWAASIKAAFDAHPEAAFIGGRVLPVWPVAPPSWLVRELWPPLSLQDDNWEYITGEDCPVCLLSKCFRREAINAAGGFEPRLGRIKDSVGSLEDDAIQRKLWKLGYRGMHVPSVVVNSPVDESRMTKEYFRRWHTGHGRHYAMLREPVFENSRGRLFDVPLHMYRSAAADSLRWILNMLCGRTAKAFAIETRLRFFQGFFVERKKEYRSANSAGKGFFREFGRLIFTLVTRHGEKASSGGVD